jgi:ABC-type multidrug transport system fused ATPase/permease subunit
MINTILFFFGYTFKFLRWRLLFSVILMIISGFTELVTLGALYPLLYLLSNQPVSNKSQLGYLSQIPGIDNYVSTNIGIVAGLFAFTIIINTFLRLLNIYNLSTISAIIGNILTKRTYEKALHQPYELLINIRSSKLIQIIYSHTTEATASVREILLLISSAIITLVMITGLMFIDFKSTFFVLVAISSIYILIIVLIRRRLSFYSININKIGEYKLNRLQASFMLIQDIILDSAQSRFVKDVGDKDLTQRIYKSKIEFLASSPRIFIESAGIILIGAIGLLLSFKGSAALPVLGVIALAAQRMMPQIQQIFTGWSFLKNNEFNNMDVANLLRTQEDRCNYKQDVQTKTRETLFAQEPINICLSNLSFKYSQTDNSVINNISLEINSGQVIGIIGESGAGKSTLINILMGLLKPTTGTLSCSGMNVYDSADSLAAYRSLISHVPQNVYLFSGTVADNIAVSSPQSTYDIKKILKVIGMVRLNELWSNELDLKTKLISDNGSNLSGGQRQRLGIARALYRDSRILVFDEATSSLDMETESEILNVIYSLPNDLVIIFIAHRLYTLKSCTHLYAIHNGSLNAQKLASYL